MQRGEKARGGEQRDGPQGAEMGSLQRQPCPGYSSSGGAPPPERGLAATSSMKSSVTAWSEAAQSLRPSPWLVSLPITYHSVFFSCFSLSLFSVSLNKYVSSSWTAESGTAWHTVGAQ